ncbi:MAG: hypothetical protein ABSD97_12060 [Acidimicrobiales bacterium]|jgi:hypothetical protein
MKVLVVGSLPPPERARAEALRVEVAGLLAEGHTVEVVAPDPIATAHRYLSARGVPGCIQLAAMVSGFDLVVVQLQAGLPVRVRAGRFERTVSLYVFSFAMRRARHVVLRLESAEDLPGGPGGRAAFSVWRGAERIVIGGEDERAEFLAAVGKRAESLAVSSTPLEEPGADDGGWGEGPEVSVENVLELVRRRAARERRALASSDVAHSPGWDRLAAPGIAMTEADVALLGPDAQRKPTDLARRVLAAADRRPALRPFVRGVRLARRGVYSVLRPARAD